MRNRTATDAMKVLPNQGGQSGGPDERLRALQWRIGGTVLMFWTVAIFLTMYNKWTFKGFGFHFPIGLVSCTFAVEWVMAACALWWRGEPVRRFSLSEWARLFIPIGIASSFQVAFSNTALLSLAVSFQTMVRSSTPVAVLLVSFILKLQPVSSTLCVIIAVVCLGTALTTAGVPPGAEFAWSGFAWLVVSIFCGGTRLCLSQVLLQRVTPRIDKLTLLFYMLPV
jgi:solute carrier family 35 protein C2